MENTNQKFRHKYAFAIIIFSLGLFFYLYEFAIRTIPSAITQELMRDFSMSAAGLGFLTSLFYYGYVSMQVPVGLLYDRFGVRVLLTFAMGVCSLGTLLFALAPHVLVANFAFFLVGFSGSFAFVGCLVIAARWFPPKYFALNVGIVQFMGCVGAIVGQAPIAYAANAFGWRATTVVFALAGFTGMVLMALLIRERSRLPNKSGKQMSSLSSAHQMSEFARLKKVMSKAQNWWAAVYAFGIWSPIVLFAGLFVIPFLIARFQVTPHQIAIASVIMWIGVGIGNPLFGWWSDLIQNRRMPAIICAVIGVISALILIYYNGHISMINVYILLFFFGLASSGQAVSFGIIQDNNPPSVSGTAIGFQNMAVIIGGTMLQPIAGTILKMFWSGEMLNGAPAYTVSDYHYALSLVPITSFIALIAAWFFIKETKCKPQYHVEENPISPNDGSSSAPMAIERS